MFVVAPFLIVALVLVLPRPAHAYLDPGTGSAVIQMVVAGVMGALFVLKMYWRKLIALFTGSEPPVDAEATLASEAPRGSDAAGPSEQSHTRDERD
jgi:hypothetical protein